MNSDACSEVIGVDAIQVRYDVEVNCSVVSVGVSTAWLITCVALVLSA